MTLEIKEITSVNEVAALRLADEAECRCYGMSGAEAVQRSVALSFAAFIATWMGETVAYFGYLPTALIGDTCQAWLLTTPVADRIPLIVAKASHIITRELSARYPTLLVNIDPAHSLAIKWLTWLGFVPNLNATEYTQMRLDRE